MKRKEILNLVIEEQQKIIDKLKDTVDRFKTASDIDEDDTIDPEDFSQQTQAKDMQLRFEKTLREAKQSLKFVQDELEEQHEKIEIGSLIETDKKWLFVGISVPLFIFEGKNVLSFSNKAPVFAAIRGKKKGDLVQIGDTEHLIQEIY